MKLTLLILWQSFLFVEYFCSPHSNMWSERRQSSEISRNINDNQDNLISELKNLGTDYTTSLKSMENILADLQDKWRDIDFKSKALKRNMGHLTNNAKPCDKNSARQENDDDRGTDKHEELITSMKNIWQKLDNTNWHVPDDEIAPLRSQMAALLYLLKGRHCESLTETFFRGGCHPIGRGEHCPHNSLMVLYDGPNNEGYCDCQNNISGGNGLFPIYSNKTDKCHFQHTQGPCNRGEWFVIKKGAPQCETVANGCFADGKHVYGRLSDKKKDWKSESKCWEIGSTSDCTRGEIVKVQQDLVEGDLQLYCSFPFDDSSSAFSISYKSQCRPGLKFNRSNKCSMGFIG